MIDIDLEVATWLTSSVGLDHLHQIVKVFDEGGEAATELAVVEAMRRRGVAGPHRRAAVSAALARRRARQRWPLAERLLFTREALEQASDPTVSRWRARRFREAPEIVDLCAGVGGDTMALAQVERTVTAVDLQAGRLELLRHNLGVVDRDVRRVTADALTFPLPPHGWVHADPGRRRAGRRVRRLRDHVPPVGELTAALGEVEAGAIVLSPAVDLHDPDLVDGELEFIQIGDDLIESVLWLGHARRRRAVASCTLLPSEDHLTRTDQPEELAVGEIGDHLLTVAPAAVRARLHTQIGERVGARRIAHVRALLTSDGQPPQDPWVRARPVETVLPARTKAVRRWLRGASSLPVEIAVHGVALEPDRWWRELGRPPRGPRGRRLDVIRTDDGAVVVVTNEQL